MAEKWYSHGLKEEDIEKLNKRYAKIVNPAFGLSGSGGDKYVALSFLLEYGSQGDHGELIDPEDIRQIFLRTETHRTPQLEGIIIETFEDDRGIFKSLSIDKELCSLSKIK